MPVKPILGITDEQRIDPGNHIADIRPLHRKILDWLAIPQNMTVTLLLLAGITFLYPGSSLWVSIFFFFLFTWGMTRGETAPIKMPIQAKMLDPHQINPGTGGASRGEGIFFLGNDLRSGKEVWLTNSDCRQHFLVLGTTGAGKAMGANSFVHTPFGWKRLGSLKLGDLVSTPDGKSAPVIGIYPQGDLPMCLFTFEDGRQVKVCSEHLWEILPAQNKNFKTNNKPKEKIDFTKTRYQRELVKTVEINARLQKGEDIFIPVSEAVEKPVQKLGVDPYLLGTLLANKSKINPNNTPNNIENFQSFGFHAAVQNNLNVINAQTDVLTKESKTNTFSSFFQPFIKNKGLYDINNIPQEYLDASITQRWHLVQGLMDQSGYFSPAEFAFYLDVNNQDLAESVQKLFWSLGAIASINPISTSNFQVKIRHREPYKFFSHPEKTKTVDSIKVILPKLQLKITSIEMNVGCEDSLCIMIDHPKHLFVTEDYVVTHNTETLLGFAANALSWGSGFLFCDGKGDVALFAKVSAMARRFNREADLLVLNFMNGNEDVGAGGGLLRSNTMNPFSTGSSDGLTQMIVSLMDDAGGDGAMWKGRATAMLTGIMRALCWLRDDGHVDLNVGVIRDYMNLKRIISLGDEKEYPDLPPHIRKSIRSYLTSLPGYSEEKKEKQAQTTLDQHGYLEMQFTKILGSLADVYGHIFATPCGEVDMYDVVLNRRILVIMLPALEKSGDEIANLGKIVVATLKGMMGATLGSRLEGGWDEIVENRQTNSPSPFLVVLDEVGYYTVEGMALMAAQARSLGFSMIYASQDIPAMKRLNEKEAASIIANTNTKVFMRTEEVAETGRLAVDTGDKGTVVRTGGFERNIGESGVNYSVGNNASFEEKNRVAFTDLKSQGEGEMHVMFQDMVVRARSFYANPEGSIEKSKLMLRANHFIKVFKPLLSDLESSRRAPELMAKMVDPKFSEELIAEAQERLDSLEEMAAMGDEIALVASSFQKIIENKRSVIESACAAVADVMRAMRGATSQFVNATAEGMHMGGREAFRSSTEVPYSSQFGSNEMDLMGEAMRDSMLSRNRMNNFDDEIGPMGSNFSQVPPPFPTPRRQMPVKAPSRVDGSIKHGVNIDDNSMISLDKDVASNEGVMNLMASLHFDSESADSDEIESRIEEALASQGDMPRSVRENVSERSKAVSAVEAFDRARAAVESSPSSVRLNANNDDDDDDDDDDENSINTGTEQNQIVSKFLEQLLSEEDD